MGSWSPAKLDYDFYNLLFCIACMHARCVVSIRADSHVLIVNEESGSSVGWMMQRRLAVKLAHWSPDSLVKPRWSPEKRKGEVFECRRRRYGQ